MKRKIFLQILGTTALSLVLLFVASVVSMYLNGQEVVRKRLKVETNLVTSLLNDPSEFHAFREYYNNHELRVTVISTEGNVLYESDIDDKLEENHLDREEVQSALSGTPTAVERYSDTFGCTMTYYAQTDTLSDGTQVVVRLAIRASEVSSYFLFALPFLILSLLLTIVIAFVFANEVSRGVSKRINEVGDSLKSLNEGQYKPLKTDVRETEFYSVFNEINELNESTHQYILREKEIAEQKSEFFANASHELKTPVTVMLGLSELLLSKEGVADGERKQIERIHKESLRMTSLISDMLKLSKLERAEEEERTETDLQEVAAEVLAELSEEAKAKGLTLELQAEGDCKLFVDPKKAFELLQNLCANAVNYNKKNGFVRVSLQGEGETLTLRVEDNGIGIEKEHIPRLCERFYRVDRSRSKKTGGTGLGLAIVKHICALYQAELTIESEIEKGTCVRVVFTKNSLTSA